MPPLVPACAPYSRSALAVQIKFLDVDKEGNRLVASHKKAIVDSTMVDLSVGAVVKGALPHHDEQGGGGGGRLSEWDAFRAAYTLATHPCSLRRGLCVRMVPGYVTAVKPYGAFIDVGGISGLLHISQISCDHIADVSTVLPQGSEIKCMVISQDKGKGRIALSTKTLEVEPGDMIKDREKVFENAEDTAAKYQERLEMERKAREEAAQDAIFGLESVFSEPTEPTEAAAEDDLPLAPAPVADLES